MSQTETTPPTLHSPVSIMAVLWVAAACIMGWKIWAEVSRIQSLGLREPSLLILSLPVVTLLLASAWLWKGRKFKYWVSTLSMLFALFMMMMVFIGTGMAEATQNVTELKQYHRALNGYWRPGLPTLASHFPDSIPADARNVHFLFTPRFLMGGARLYLHYQTSTEEIQRLRRIASKARTISIGLNGSLAGVPEMNHFPRPLYLPEFAESAELPEDFECYYFDQVPPDVFGEEWAWNRGATHGMAFSDQRKEVLYWADYW